MNPMEMLQRLWAARGWNSPPMNPNEPASAMASRAGRQTNQSIHSNPVDPMQTAAGAGPVGGPIGEASGLMRQLGQSEPMGPVGQKALQYLEQRTPRALGQELEHPTYTRYLRKLEGKNPTFSLQPVDENASRGYTNVPGQGWGRDLPVDVPGVNTMHPNESMARAHGMETREFGGRHFANDPYTNASGEPSGKNWVDITDFSPDDMKKWLGY